MNGKGGLLPSSKKMAELHPRKVQIKAMGKKYSQVMLAVELQAASEVGTRWVKPDDIKQYLCRGQHLSLKITTVLKATSVNSEGGRVCMHWKFNSET